VEMALIVRKLLPLAPLLLPLPLLLIAPFLGNWFGRSQLDIENAIMQRRLYKCKKQLKEYNYLYW